MWISVKIAQYIAEKGGPCKVIQAPFAVYIANDEHNYVEPDVTVICDRDKLDEKGCHGAPDWAIEIVSPSSKTMDYIRKCALYEQAGVREYWIVDPKERSILVYDFEHGVSGQYSFADHVKAGIYDDLFLHLAEAGEKYFILIRISSKLRYVVMCYSKRICHIKGSCYSA